MSNGNGDNSTSQGAEGEPAKGGAGAGLPRSRADTNAKNAVRIYDTTLRDGTQREGISLSADDKLRIAERLDEFGVDFIEGGWPGSNPKDQEFFRRARDRQWKRAVITAFGATRRAGVPAEADAQLRTLLDAGTPACTIFGKSWTLHVTEVLQTGLDENVRMIEDTVRFLRENGRRVVYDAEHFFDGYADDPAYAVETLRAAVRGGAEAVALCDTNGGTMPWVVEEVVGSVVEALRPGSESEGGGVTVGIHTHNDAECAVANALAAVRAGARHVQGTINGYGERCGNANLCAIVPSLELKLGARCLPHGNLQELYDLSRFVAEVANLPVDEHMAYVGKSAFAHKGGVHVAAMRRSERSYQHIDPSLVGNRSRVLVSELSGRGNVLAKAEEYGVVVDGGKERHVLERIKEGEARGFSYEAAEASVALLVHREREGYEAPFEVLDFRAESGQRGGTEPYAEATVKVRVGDETMHTAAEGNGPVSALDRALRKALEPFFPALRGFHLADYKVRILDGTEGTAATTRVLIDHRDEHRSWSTVGASSNIIEASFLALVDGIEFGILGLEAGARPDGDEEHRRYEQEARQSAEARRAETL
ncbi:MAG: citramalate synthase [Myxococcota bacterium]